MAIDGGVIQPKMDCHLADAGCGAMMGVGVGADKLINFIAARADFGIHHKTPFIKRAGFITNICSKHYNKKQAK